MKNVMAVTESDEFDVIYIEEAVCRHVVGQVVGTPLMASAVWDRVPLTFTRKVRRLKETFITVYYSGCDAVSSGFIWK